MSYWTEILPNVDDGELRISATALAVFFDETGDETMRDPITPLFGRGGVAILGMNYEDHLAKPWRQLKRNHFGGEGQVFHAAAFQRSRPTEAQIDAVNSFCENPFYRLAAMVGVDTSLPPTMDASTTVAWLLKDMVRKVAARHSLTRVDVVFESSQRGNALAERDFSDWPNMADRQGQHLPVTCFFANKSAMIPGLEVADLVMHTCAREERRRRSGSTTEAKPDFQRLYQTESTNGFVSYISVTKVEGNT